MSFTRTLKCHFFRVLPLTSKDAITNTLVEIGALAEDDVKRVQESERRAPIMLAHAELSGALWLIDVVRIRMDVDAKRASIKGLVSALRLEDHEGIGEESAVLYDPTAQVMIIQSGRETVTKSDIEFYFASKGSIPNLDLQPALVREGYLKMQRMTVIRKLEVSVAGLSSGKVWGSEDLAVKAMANLEKRFEAPSL